MATDQEDVLMSSVSATQPIETSTPDQNLGDHSGTPDGERAAKRLKTDGSAPTLTESSGPVPESNGSAPTNPVSDVQPLPEHNGSRAVAAVEAEAKVNDGEGSAPAATAPEPRKGVAPIKKEFLINASKPRVDQRDQVDDDAAEARSDQVQKGQGRDKDKGKKEKRSKGQNTERSFGQFGDTIRLCHTRAHFSEFSPQECRFGDGCKQSHDLRKYLAEGRRGDLEIFDGICPVFIKFGKCSTGWKCRFVKSHMREVEHEDGRKELVLVDNTVEEGKNDATDAGKEEDLDSRKDQRYGVFNTIGGDIKYNLSRKKVDFTKADQYIQWTDQEAKVNHAFNHRRGQPGEADVDDLRAQFVDPPFKASEKRRLYFGPETPALAPLTTQGNLPFRRLCVELGAQLTYSEMAVGLPLVQGATSDWTLFKAHESEMLPPRVKPATNVSGTSNLVFDGYDNARDIRFGAQISANLPWVAIKAADALNRFCPHLRLIDLNCGCPIDMIFKSGGGSALLDAGPKLERMIRGMNAMSGETPITAKIRTGVKSNRPTAQQIIGRLAFGAREHRARLGAPGCAAITLHGRSREQRYTRTADWGFIGECAALVKTYNEQKDALTDTAAEPDPSTLPNTKDGKMFFLGNGDCYSHVDYQEHIENARVDSIMIGRGALIKPWIFEEIEKGQYLDKSASERLTYIEKFVRYGLEAWGSDELGIGFTRRFLCEWLSFTHRYVPIGLLERLPPSLNDRPPAYQGRNDLETLMASTNYKDWVKISEMFLGPSQPGFKFQPKHKSNAYEAEG